jgi:hypothetical protein
VDSKKSPAVQSNKPAENVIATTLVQSKSSMVAAELGFCWQAKTSKQMACKENGCREHHCVTQAALQKSIM